MLSCPSCRASQANNNAQCHALPNTNPVILFLPILIESRCPDSRDAPGNQPEGFGEMMRRYIMPYRTCYVTCIGARSGYHHLSEHR